jgi:hypothetical protein
MNLVKQKLIYNLSIALLAFGLNIILVSQAFALESTEVIDFVNQSRAENGFSKLRENEKLKNAALSKANDMVNYDYFAHTSPANKTPWEFIRAAGYNYIYAGENLAIGYNDPRELHEAWMNSVSHRENILNKNYREIGIGIVTGEFEGVQTTVVVQMFGTTIGEQMVYAANDGFNNTNFKINKEKTGLSSTSVFAGEPLEIKVAYSGEVSQMNALVGDQTFNLSDSTNIEQAGEDKIIKKEVRLEQSGKYPISLTTTDKEGNQHSIILGQLTVNDKIIAKNEVVNNWEKIEIINFIIGLSLVLVMTVSMLILTKNLRVIHSVKYK